MTVIRRAAMPLAFLASFGVLWVVRPGVVENAARSPVAWAVGAGVFLAGLGMRVAARRLGAPPVLAQALGIGLIVVLVAILLAPSFRQRTVIEDLPDALTAGPRATASAGKQAATTTPPSTGLPAGGATTATASAATRPTGAVPKPAATAATPATTAPTTTAPTSPTTAAPAPTPQPGGVDRTGALRGIGHSASGNVHLRTLDGTAYVVFDDVNIEGSVKPSVHLVPAGQRTPSGGIRLGPLKAEKGTFSYALPAEVDPTRDWSVLVWCDPYDTPIAAADPT